MSVTVDLNLTGIIMIAWLCLLFYKLVRKKKLNCIGCCAPCEMQTRNG